MRISDWSSDVCSSDLGGIDGSIGATASWALGLAAVAAVAFFSLKARSKRLRYGFPVKPLWAEVAMIAVWLLLILGFGVVMDADTKPRSENPRSIPTPEPLRLLVWGVRPFRAR